MESENKGQLSRSERKRGQKFALVSNMFANVTVYIITGALMMLYAGDVLGLPSSEISHILALIPLISLIRILLLPLLKKPGKVLLLRSCTLIQWVIILTMVLVPPRSLSYSLYLFLLVAYSLVGQLGAGTVWQPLMRDITTVNDRGRFFSRMRFVFTLVNLSVTGVIPLIIGEAVSSGEYKIFLILVLFTLLIRFFTLKHIPERPYPERKKASFRWQGFKKELAGLKYPLMVQMLAQFSFFPVLVLYLRQNLALPANMVTLAVFVMTLGNAVSLLFWGSVSDTVGFRNMMGGVHLLGLVQAPLLLFILPGGGGGASLSCLFLFMFLNGLIMSGSGIGTTSIQHYFTNNRNSFAMLNIYAAAALLGNSLWTFFTGSLLDSAHPALTGILSRARGEFIHLDGIKIFLLLIPQAIRLILMLMLRKLPNIRPWFGLSDFFTSLNPHSFRTMALTGRLHRLDDRSRDKAVRTLGRHTTPLGIHSLTELLKDPSYDVKVNAIRELGRSGSPLAVRRLAPLLAKADMAIYHEHIIWALGELQWEEGVEPLCEILGSHRSERIKAEAARALGKIGDKRAISPLTEVLEEITPSYHLSSSACRALISLDPENQSPRIFSVLPLYRDNNIRYEIMAALCPLLEISDSWLLKYGQDQGAYQALLEEAEGRSRPWRRDKAEILKALESRDGPALEALYNRRFTGNKPVTLALRSSLSGFDGWNPVFLLAAARLLLL